MDAKNAIAKFEAIERAFSALDTQNMRKGVLPMRETAKGYWSPAIMKEVFDGFTQMGLSNYRRFLDLGSGDGRVVLIASLFVPMAEGVEIDRELHEAAIAMAKKLEIPAIFHHKDLHSIDISPYDALFISPDAPLERGIEGKLLREMKGDLIVYGNHFHPRILRKKKGIKVNGMMIGIYSKP